MRLNLFYRKAYPTAFSIERLFDQLTGVFAARGLDVRRLELPEYNNTLGNVRTNNRWARAQVQGSTSEGPCVHHITGDVNSIVFALRGPTVITIHDCNPLLRYPRWHPRYWFYRWVIFEGPARRAAAVTVISEKTRRELLDLTRVGSSKLHVIPNFVDPAFTHHPREFNDSRPTILQIGVKPNKNLARLAEALAGVPCRLEIIGQPSSGDLAALEANGVDFHWATGLSDEAVRQRYTDCDLLAFVSTYEGFGLPILEAQVTGRAVVTSDLSPHREVAGDGGAELVDPLDPASIREGILRVIQQPDYRKQLIERGRQNVADYHIEAIADRYLDLYSSLL
ncbi:glycosyltransferase involved in cell wall biosynthesis [Lewinella marina]|uniref:Group 1 glycosyl transferase n=1 Tax=Neolewinella marina TaxID=438751 RepID=A0A2G0CE62_9BACT|nr:glycosyltransferase family 1 protein [Neolewinella marina]NJB87432.1 glycosyltransferase involved in cell wall biosynthesis [Neolewinella marina]PHK98259.1 group 1 glycosyl transferase [Neolewinella marina]